MHCFYSVDVNRLSVPGSFCFFVFSAYFSSPLSFFSLLVSAVPSAQLLSILIVRRSDGFFMLLSLWLMLQ